MNMKKLFTLITLITILSAAAWDKAYSAGHEFGQRVALIVAKKSRSSLDVNTINTLRNLDRGYGAEKEADNVKEQKSADDYYTLGVSHDEAGRYEEAIEAYKRAIRMKPEYADAHYNLAVSYLMMNNSISAHAEYTALKNIDSLMADNLYEQMISLMSSSSDNRYIMQVGAYRNMKYAGEMIEALRSQYMFAYIKEVGGLNKVRILGLKSKEEAGRMMEEINRRFHVKPLLFPAR